MGTQGSGSQLRGVATIQMGEGGLATELCFLTESPATAQALTTKTKTPLNASSSRLPPDACLPLRPQIMEMLISISLTIFI